MYKTRLIAAENFIHLITAIKRLSRRMTIVTVALGFGLVFSGCAFRSAVISWTMAPLIEDAMASVMAESDPDMARTAMASQLSLLEALLRGDPENEKLLVTAAMGYCGYAMMFLESADDRRAAMLYRRAADYGHRALAIGERGFSKPAMNTREFEALAGTITEPSVPAAYWTAAAMAGMANLDRMSPAAMAQFPRAVALMRRVELLRPDYFYSGARWFLGVYYASLPPIAGGSLDKARGYFSRAIQDHGEHFLWGRLLFASVFAVQALDRALFEEQIAYIINYNQEPPEDLKLLNAVAVVKAKSLARRVNELF